MEESVLSPDASEEGEIDFDGVAGSGVLAVEDWVMGAVYTFISSGGLASTQVEVPQAAVKLSV